MKEFTCANTHDFEAIKKSLVSEKINQVSVHIVSGELRNWAKELEQFLKESKTCRDITVTFTIDSGDREFLPIPSKQQIQQTKEKIEQEFNASVSQYFQGLIAVFKEESIDLTLKLIFNRTFGISKRIIQKVTSNRKVRLLGPDPYQGPFLYESLSFSQSFELPEIKAITQANLSLKEDYSNKEIIEINDANFRVEHVKKLVEKLQANSILKQLSLINCQLDNELIKLLIEYLKKHSVLTDLDLTNNRINDAGLTSLLQSLPPTLYCLRLAGNQLGDKEIESLCSELKPFSRLMTLDLSNNEITNSGLRKLAKPIENHRNLTSLDLRGNKFITGSGLFALADCLVKNRVLRRLYLPDDSMDENSAKEFIKTLSSKKKRGTRNAALIELYLKGWKDIPNKERLTKKQEETAWWEKFKKDNIIHKDETRYLVDFVASANFLNENKNNAQKLLEANELSELEKLLKSASLYTCRDFNENEDGNSLLHLAVNAKKIDIIRYLLSLNFNKEIRNKAGKTALQLAQEANEQELVKCLTEASANSSKKASSKKRSQQADSDEEASADETKVSPAPKKQKLSPIVIEEEMDAMVAEDLQDDAVPAEDMPEENRQVLLPTRLISLVAEGQAYSLNLQLKEKDIFLTDAEGNTLLHHAVRAGQLASAEIIFSKLSTQASAKICNKKNQAGETALHSVIKILVPSQQPRLYLDMAWLLIKKGANPNVTIAVPELDRERVSALHLAVIHEQYILTKILLASPQCDLDQADSGNWNALDWVLAKRNPALLSRLLIDRRIAIESLTSTVEYWKKQEIASQDKILTQMLQLIMQCKSKPQLSAAKGIHWVQNFTVLFGSHYAKSQRALKIKSDKQHSYLMSHNLFTANRVYAFKQEDSKDIQGNPVTASLVFLVSAVAYQPNASVARQKIRVNLNFTPAYHISQNALTSREELDRIKHRTSLVNSQVLEKKKESNGHIKDLEEIEALYNQEAQSNESAFARLFRHGEQALLDHLEQPETIAQIVSHLQQDPKFAHGCKVYGLILELHSPRYLCGNCEIGILGEQNAEQSKFLNQLAALLVKRGCILPRYNVLRMLTQASSYIPFPHEQNLVTADEHQEVVVDFRSCQNELILARDSAAFGYEPEDPKFTQYHSNQNLA